MRSPNKWDFRTIFCFLAVWPLFNDPILRYSSRNSSCTRWDGLIMLLNMAKTNLMTVISLQQCRYSQLCLKAIIGVYFDATFLLLFC